MSGGALSRPAWLRPPRQTIRLRLTLLFGALFLLAGAALLTVTYLLVEHRFTMNGSSFFVATGTAGGGLVGAAQHSGPVRLGGAGTLPGSLLSPAGSVPAPAQVLAAAKRSSSAALNQLLLDSGIALAIMAVISIWLGWVVAGRALRPLRSITSAAREISASNLHRRLALTGPDDELRQLGNTFDDLLSRLESAFEAQRRFVANASHELRTPLTFERTLVEVALADPHPTVESLRRACEQVLAAGEQQERLIEALLTLSRGQRGLERHDEVDLAALANESLEALDRGALTVTTGFEPASTEGDPRLVERLITNLLANAVRHNLPRGWLDVRTATASGHAVLTVSNSGPPIPGGELERLVQPFQRLDQARTSREDGLGLGLSIVQAIAEAHGAVLTLEPLPGGGLRAVVSFPAGRERAPRERERPGSGAEPAVRVDPVRR